MQAADGRGGLGDDEGAVAAGGDVVDRGPQQHEAGHAVAGRARAGRVPVGEAGAGAGVGRTAEGGELD